MNPNNTFKLLLLIFLLNYQVISAQTTSFKGKVKSLYEAYYHPQILPGGMIIQGTQLDSIDLYAHLNYYDLQGRSIETYSFDIDQTTNLHMTCMYDSIRKHSQTCIYDASGTLIRTLYCTFDNQWNSLEATAYIDSLLYSKITWKYNPQGQLTETILYNGSKQLSKTAYTYDSKGNQIQEITYDHLGQMQTAINRNFDDQGNITEEAHYLGSRLQQKKTLEYDSHGNVIRKNTRYVNGIIVNQSYTYHYDSIGNWIEKIVFSDEKPQYLIWRKITYYSE